VSTTTPASTTTPVSTENNGNIPPEDGAANRDPP
jgi:hypothetical protein